MTGMLCCSAIVFTIGGCNVRPCFPVASGLVTTRLTLYPLSSNASKPGALKSAVPKNASGIDFVLFERFEFAII